MLLELRAENYAVIDRAVATFGLGLNLLTGETGAGKSILIDALALLLGGKASPDHPPHLRVGRVPATGHAGESANVAAASSIPRGPGALTMPESGLGVKRVCGDMPWPDRGAPSRLPCRSIGRGQPNHPGKAPRSGGS